MSRGSPHFWVKYIIPEDAKLHSTTSGSNDTVRLDMTEFDHLMMEARGVLSRYFLFVLDALVNYNYLKVNIPVTIMCMNSTCNVTNE